jgi:hypothetical protein
LLHLVKVMHDLVLVLHHFVRAGDKRGSSLLLSLLSCFNLRLRSKQERNLQGLVADLASRVADLASLASRARG